MADSQKDDRLMKMLKLNKVNNPSQVASSDSAVPQPPPSSEEEETKSETPKAASKPRGKKRSKMMFEEKNTVVAKSLAEVEKATGSTKEFKTAIDAEVKRLSAASAQDVVGWAIDEEGMPFVFVKLRDGTSAAINSQSILKSLYAGVIDSNLTCRIGIAMGTADIETANMKMEMYLRHSDQMMRSITRDGAEVKIPVAPPVVIKAAFDRYSGAATKAISTGEIPKTAAAKPKEPKEPKEKSEEKKAQAPRSEEGSEKPKPKPRARKQKESKPEKITQLSLAEWVGSEAIRESPHGEEIAASNPAREAEREGCYGLWISTLSIGSTIRTAQTCTPAPVAVTAPPDPLAPTLIDEPKVVPTTTTVAVDPLEVLTNKSVGAVGDVGKLFEEYVKCVSDDKSKAAPAFLHLCAKMFGNDGCPQGVANREFKDNWIRLLLVLAEYAISLPKEDDLFATDDGPDNSTLREFVGGMISLNTSKLGPRFSWWKEHLHTQEFEKFVSGADQMQHDFAGIALALVQALRL